jgi:Icc-related predicted phosphoesterase
LKFVTIADTHGLHHELNLPPGDVLIHAGDVSMKGNREEVEDFLSWFAGQDFAYKIFVAGNHDFFFEREADDEIHQLIPDNVIYLNNSHTILNGLKIWGSPITPWFFNWAFNRHRGEPIQRYWDLIPSDTDIIITHGPVFRALDKTTGGEHVGCKDLFNKVQEVKPKVHICGHIHESYGTIVKSGITFINASAVNARYERVNRPIVFELQIGS